MQATVTNFPTNVWRTLKGSAGMLPALSGILPDSMRRLMTSEPTKMCVVRRQHADGDEQNGPAPQL
jgi:hypothetical protein